MVRAAFEKRSSNGIFVGCVGAIDGMLATTKTPTHKESEGNPRSYFSGHYNQHGLNVQAVCNARCRFIFFSVAAPGKTSDQVAFERTSLYKKIQNLPPGLYLVGDAAYVLCDQLLIPFTGSQRQNPENDAYNFFLSQLRIRIEMSFGLLTSKFTVLRNNLQTKLQRSLAILECCARLHNFVINEDWDESMENMEEQDLDIGNLANSPNGEWGYLPIVEQFAKIPGTSIICEAIVERGCKTKVSNNQTTTQQESVKNYLRWN